MAKQFMFKGKTLEELQQMNLEEFSQLLDSRKRRALKRGLTKQQKKLLERIRRNKDRPVRTHVRDMIILPEMINKKISIHSGQSFEIVTIMPEMLGHMLGEFSQTRGRVRHSAPGVGATRSSKFVPLK